jgi:hypothetical protein
MMMRMRRGNCEPAPERSWLFLPNPRKCKISLGWGHLTDRKVLYAPGEHVRVRYTHTGRQGQSQKPVNIGLITEFSDRQ